jgi:hypothetical protein
MTASTSASPSSATRSERAIDSLPTRRTVPRPPGATVHFVVRSWIRQALRASGVAILVPAAVAAAIALSVLGGGHSVGSLGDVLRGPAVPPAEAAGLRGQTPQSRPLRLGGQSLQSHMRLRGQTPQSRRQAARTPATLPFRPAPRRPTARPPASQQPAPAQPPPAPPAPPPPAPHPIHDTGTQVAETVRPLPLAGPAAADAVEAVVNLVDPA